MSDRLSDEETEVKDIIDETFWKKVRAEAIKETAAAVNAEWVKWIENNSIDEEYNEHPVLIIRDEQWQERKRSVGS